MTTPMRRVYYVCIGLSISILTLASCTPISECKNCEAVTYDKNDGHEISRESAIEYCGQSLNDKINAAPVIHGDEKTVWECH